MQAHELLPFRPAYIRCVQQAARRPKAALPENHQEETMQNYPASDKNFDLVSSLYHFSQGVEMSKRYAEDAKHEGDQEAADFFRKSQEQYAQLGEKAKELLKQRL
jgi:hypothetical protein